MTIDVRPDCYYPRLCKLDMNADSDKIRVLDKEPLGDEARYKHYRRVKVKAPTNIIIYWGSARLNNNNINKDIGEKYFELFE